MVDSVGDASLGTFPLLYRELTASSSCVVFSASDLTVLALHSLLLDVAFVPASPSSSFPSPAIHREGNGDIFRRILPSTWNEGSSTTGVYSLMYTHPLWRYPVSQSKGSCDTNRRLEVKCVLLGDQGLLAIHGVDTGDGDTVHSLENLRIRDYFNCCDSSLSLVSGSKRGFDCPTENNLAFDEISGCLESLYSFMMSGFVSKLFASALFPRTLVCQPLLEAVADTRNSSMADQGTAKSDPRAEMAEQDRDSQKGPESSKGENRNLKFGETTVQEKDGGRSLLEDNQRVRGYDRQYPPGREDGWDPIDPLGIMGRGTGGGLPMPMGRSRFTPDGNLIGPNHPGFGGSDPFARGRGVRFDPFDPFGGINGGEPTPDHMPRLGGMPDHMFL